MTRVCIDIDGDGGNGSVPTVKSYTTTIGDGSQLDYAIDHNLGDRYGTVQVVDVATGLRRDDVDVTYNTDNRATLRFDAAPAPQSVRVNVLSVKPPTA